MALGGPEAFPVLPSLSLSPSCVEQLEGSFRRGAAVPSVTVSEAVPVRPGLAAARRPVGLRGPPQRGQGSWKGSVIVFT